MRLVVTHMPKTFCWTVAVLLEELWFTLLALSHCWELYACVTLSLGGLCTEQEFGEVVVSGSWDGSLVVVRVSDSSVVRRYAAHTNWVRTCMPKTKRTTTEGCLMEI